MEIINKNIRVKLNNPGEINSLKFKDIEIFHQPDDFWGKTFPIIWPSLATSSGFEVNGKNYEMPRHGFWKELNWKSISNTHSSIVNKAIHKADDVYPFDMEITLKVDVETDDTLTIVVEFKNTGSEVAYFHFGHHPSFYINESSTLKGYGDAKANMIMLDSSGSDKTQDLSKELMSIPFGKDFDTLIFKGTGLKSVSYNYKNLEITTDFDADNLQLWKPKGANFICIEPWQGESDMSYNASVKAKEKSGIVELASGKTWNNELLIKIKDVTTN